MSQNLYRRPSLLAFTLCFVPFCLLFCVSLLLPELEDNLVLLRTLYTIRASLVLTLPALCLFALGPTVYQRSSYWLLFWTFGFIIYLFHFLYAVFGVHGGDIGAIYERQGWLVATNNFLVTFWWLADVVLAWFARDTKGWIGIQRWLVHGLVYLNFIVAAVFLKEGLVRALGLAMTFTVLIFAVIRLWFGHIRKS